MADSKTVEDTALLLVNVNDRFDPNYSVSTGLKNSRLSFPTQYYITSHTDEGGTPLSKCAWTNSYDGISYRNFSEDDYADIILRGQASTIIFTGGPSEKEILGIYRAMLKRYNVLCGEEDRRAYMGKRTFVLPLDCIFTYGQGEIPYDPKRDGLQGGDKTHEFHAALQEACDLLGETLRDKNNDKDPYESCLKDLGLSQTLAKRIGMDLRRWKAISGSFLPQRETLKDTNVRLFVGDEEIPFGDPGIQDILEIRILLELKDLVKHI